MAASGPSSPDTTKETTDNSAATAAGETAMSAEAKAAAPAAAKSSSEGAPEPTKSTKSKRMPTYLTTKQSKAYTLSKQLLAAGSLDDALSTLEVALQFSREMLINSLSDASDEIELHESLAPLYYLYGTTLLYSVEESDVMMASGTAANASGGAGGSSGEEKQEVGDIEVEVPPENENNDNPVDANENEGGQAGQPDAEEDDEDAPPAVDTAEDLQIAWENLDLARSIVSHLAQDFHPQSMSSSNSNSTTQHNPIKLKSTLPKSDPSSYNTPELQSELLLDLAQIHTRLGDLQRGNANILSCIDDYNHALTLRTATLGKFDKKVADSHFSLAAVYAEAPNRVGENEGKVEHFVSQLGGAGGGASNHNMDGDSEVVLSEDDKKEMRQKSLEHYLACGVAFAGLMAQLCGEDAEKFCEEIESVDESVESTTAASAASASASASAASASAASASTNNSNSAAKSLATLRQKLAKLVPPSSKVLAEEFNDLKEMMDEIQEAMDSAEETEEGLKSLGEMKANEMKKHEMKQNDNGGEGDGGEGFVETSADGAMTTIGFGKPSAAAAAAAAASSTAVNAFGASTSSAAAASASNTVNNNAPTMMVVKKKKKKIHPTQVQVAGGDKESDAKRLKTN